MMAMEKAWDDVDGGGGEGKMVATEETQDNNGRDKVMGMEMKPEKWDGRDRGLRRGTMEVTA